MSQDALLTVAWCSGCSAAAVIDPHWTDAELRCPYCYDGLLVVDVAEYRIALRPWIRNGVLAVLAVHDWLAGERKKKKGREGWQPGDPDPFYDSSRCSVSE